MIITSVPRVATMERARGALARERRARVDAELETARAKLLARTGAALDSSLELEQTLRALAGVCVPELGSLCVVEVIEEDGRVRRLTVAEGVGERGMMERLATYPANAGHGLCSDRTIADGASLLLRRVTDAELHGLMPDAERAALWSGILPASFMCAPLRLGMRPAGAIALVAGGNRRAFDASDLEMLQAIASRASVAVANARAYDSARRASALRDEVLAIVSHDLRNPLAAIAMALTRLSDGSDLPTHRREDFLKIANASVDWMQRMIQDLLDVASIDSGKLSIERRDSDLVVLLVLAASMFEQTCAEHGIQLVTELPERLPRANVDSERILQLVGNLLSNAVKFSPRGSRITLSVAERGRDLVVSVRDTGPGIAPEDVPRIFDRFWHSRRTSSVRGTGLGLSIAKGIVDAHGGRIWVDTLLGSGSTFLFSLPRSTSDTPARPSIAVRIPPAAELPTFLSTAL